MSNLFGDLVKNRLIDLFAPLLVCHNTVFLFSLVFRRKDLCEAKPNVECLKKCSKYYAEVMHDWDYAMLGGGRGGGGG